jgi:hypothetical protein
MEIESALVAHPKVAEAAVVSKPHDIKGESAFAYVVLNVPRPQGAPAKALIEELRAWVGEQLSPIAKPDEIRLTDNLPKTRSGKIMRRLLRAVARGEEITQDMSTLENPAILEQLRGVEPAPAKATAAPKKAAKQAVKKAVKNVGKKVAKKAAGKVVKKAVGKTKSAAKSAKRKVTAGKVTARKVLVKRKVAARKGATQRAKPSRGAKLSRPRTPSARRKK